MNSYTPKYHTNYTQPAKPTVYLSLPLTTSLPDPLGFASVSGLYGPGAWLAWYLSILASWLHLVYFLRGRVKRGDKFWVNSIIYLLGLNWAAVDFLRHQWSLGSLFEKKAAEAETEVWKTEAASVGAAMVMVYWGFSHATAQMLMLLLGSFDFGRRKKALRRASVLALGLIVPIISFISTSWFLAIEYDFVNPFAVILISQPRKSEPVDLIPAFYWKGMQSEEGETTYYGHTTYMEYAYIYAIMATFPVVPLAVYGVVQTARVGLFSAVVQRVLRRLIPIWNVLGRPITFTWWLVQRILFSIVAVIVCGISFFTCAMWPMMLFTAILSVIRLVWYSIMGFIYVCMAYTSGKNLDGACFFMPCAPQKIADTDQAGALFVALVLLVGGEFVLPMYKCMARGEKGMGVGERDIERQGTMSGAYNRLLEDETRLGDETVEMELVGRRVDSPSQAYDSDDDTTERLAAGMEGQFLNR